jgi:sulfate adenylyltransferase
MSKYFTGDLVNRVLKDEAREEAEVKAGSLPRIAVDTEMAAEVENIATGVFTPLTGFMNRQDYEGVLENMRLSDDTPWPLPVVLDVGDTSDLSTGSEVALVEGDNPPFAVMTVTDIFPLDKERHAGAVYGTLDESHPGVAATRRMKSSLVAGPVTLIHRRGAPFEKYSLTPMETRILFREKGWRQVVGFQTRNVPHLGHEYVQKTALTFVDGIFINPVIGKKKAGDFTDDVILDSYQALIDNYYLKERAVMAILRYQMRYAGPREAVFHAIVRRNFGCTHFIVGRDHAGVGDFYGPFEAQEIFDEFPDLGIVPVFFNTFSYCRKCDGVVNEKTCPHGEEYHVSFSGTKMREMLENGEIPSPELMRPEVAEIIISYKQPFVE